METPSLCWNVRNLSIAISACGGLSSLIMRRISVDVGAHVTREAYLAARKHDFDEDTKVKVLLWCARHCCLCGKFAGVGIEVAHLDPKSSEIDNAMPLCFDCHAAIGHYNRRHPRGRKYSIRELKARRDQVYEEWTRHLVPPVSYKLTQAKTILPDVGFVISNDGDTYPILARIRVGIVKGSRDFGLIQSGHYDGTYLWNLNPRFSIYGHFAIPDGAQNLTIAPLRAKVEVSLTDVYGREHALLPMGYVLAAGEKEWYFEPSVEALGPAPGNTAG